MNQLLGSTAGNALEVREALDVLTGRAREPRLSRSRSRSPPSCCGSGGLADDEDGAARRREALASGAAAERFARMVAALGGPADLLDDPARHLAAAPDRARGAPASARASCRRSTSRALGLAVVALGGGRRREDDADRPRRRARSRSPGSATRSARTARWRSCTRATRRARRGAPPRAVAVAAFAVGAEPAAPPPLTEALA